MIDKRQQIYRLTASTLDDSSVSADFTVTFQYACWDAILGAIELVGEKSEFIIDLYLDLLSVEFKEISLISPGCTLSPTFDYVYDDGPEHNFLNSLTFKDNIVKSNKLSEKSLLGSHMFRLQGNLGVYKS